MTMKHEETRQRLIDGTIRVIARDGLDKATTKHIGLETSINEVYIYRCFDSKEDLFAKTFAFLDEELVEKAMEGIPLMATEGLSFRERSWLFFSAVWRFILDRREKCTAYIRYYYSPYFVSRSSEAHRGRYSALVDHFKVMFLEESNVWMIMNHILSTMLVFAIKVFNGDVPDDEDTAEHVFRLIYSSISQYFKKEIIEE